MKKIKRLFIGVFTLIAIFILGSCSSSEAQETKFVAATNRKLAYSATTALSIINTEEDLLVTNEEESSVVEETPTPTTEVTEAPTEETPQVPTEPTENPTADYLPDIIEQADLILANDANFSFISIESDKEDYLNLNIISFNNFDGTTQTFKLYYNDVTEKVETEEDEVETEVSYFGIVVYNGLEYTFDFESKSEIEDDESEVKTKLIIHTGENSYISIINECEIEEDEKEEKFTYKVVENDEVIVSYSISNETEDDQTKIKVRINDLTIKIEEIVKDDKHYISIKDDKCEALFERYEDENGHHKYHLVENQEEANKHFEESFKGFEEMFKDSKENHE